MTALNIQAAQNDIIRQVLNTQDIHLLDRIRNLFAQKEANEACMVQEEPCMTKDEILSGFDNALHELKSYREGGGQSDGCFFSAAGSTRAGAG